MKNLTGNQMEVLTGGAAPLSCDQMIALAYLSAIYGNPSGYDYWMYIYNLSC